MEVNMSIAVMCDVPVVVVIVMVANLVQRQYICLETNSDLSITCASLPCYVLRIYSYRSKVSSYFRPVSAPI